MKALWDQYAAFFRDWQLTYWDGVLMGGAGALLVLLLLYWLVRRAIGGSEGRHAISIPGSEGGRLTIAVGALRQFVAMILTEFPDASLRKVLLGKKRGGCSLTVVVELVPGADAVALQAKLSRRVREETGRKLGMGEILKEVSVHVVSCLAKEEKIARRARRTPGAGILGGGHVETEDSLVDVEQDAGGDDLRF